MVDQSFSFSTLILFLGGMMWWRNRQQEWGH
jgi:hypothetical protein